MMQRAFGRSDKSSMTTTPSITILKEAGVGGVADSAGVDTATIPRGMSAYEASSESLMSRKKHIHYPLY